MWFLPCEFMFFLPREFILFLPREFMLFLPREFMFFLPCDYYGYACYSYHVSIVFALTFSNKFNYVATLHDFICLHDKDKLK